MAQAPGHGSVTRQKIRDFIRVEAAEKALPLYEYWPGMLAVTFSPPAQIGLGQTEQAWIVTKPAGQQMIVPPIHPVYGLM